MHRPAEVVAGPSDGSWPMYWWLSWSRAPLLLCILLSKERLHVVDDVPCSEGRCSSGPYSSALSARQRHPDLLRSYINQGHVQTSVRTLSFPITPTHSTLNRLDTPTSPHQTWPPPTRPHLTFKRSSPHRFSLLTLDNLAPNAVE